MRPESAETGRIEYTSRAFQQDANEAMRGDIVRGLIELITNSDDAYLRCGARDGRIRVEVEHRRRRFWRVVVKDRGPGMSPSEMRDRIARLGTRSSGFETGAAVRGNRGRGAKDLAAFGTVVFESIKDDQYAKFSLDQDGTYDLSRPCLATPQHRDALGIQRNGMVVTVTVNPSIRCPLHDRLRDQLSKHYQLRYITMDPARELTLVNANNPNESARITYQVTEGESVFHDRIAVAAFPDAQVTLSICRLPERCDAGAADPYRPSGVLICGRRTVYQNTFFGLEGNPYIGWFAGRLDCCYIDELVRDFDDRVERGTQPDPNNPIPIVTRRRDGISAEHPFARALADAVEPILREVAEAEERRQRDTATVVANEESRLLLSRLSREAARFLQEQLRELDAEDPPAVPGEGVLTLQIVPPGKLVTVGETATLSLLASEDWLDGDTEALLSVEPGGIIDLVDGASTQLRPHRRRAGLLSAPIRVRGLLEGEALLGATVAGREDAALITVAPPRPAPEPEPPEDFEFEHPQYRVVWNRRKPLRLRTPSSVADQFGLHVQCQSDHPGVVLLGGGTRLHPVAAGAWYEADVVVEGRALGSRAAITARLGRETARTRVIVQQRDETLPDLHIEPVHKEAGIYRAVFEPPEPRPEQRQVLEVMAKHPSLRTLLGPAPDFEGQNTAEWKAVLAEVVTEAIVRRILERKYPAGSDPATVQDFYSDVFRYSSRLLPLMQRTLGLVD